MRLIKLTQGKYAQVDDEDWEQLSAHKWYAQRARYTFYAIRGVYPNGAGSRVEVRMHHQILGGKPERGREVDHIDGSGLNNQKGNLREVTRSQNLMNRQKRSQFSSIYKGVHWSNPDNRWRAQIKIAGKQTYLGLFASEEEAARAYDREALKQFGEFSRLNLETAA